MSNFKTIFSVLIIVLVAGIAYSISDNFKSAPLPAAPKDEISSMESLEGFTVPGGFALSIFAKDLPGARVIAFDDEDNMWVSQTNRGTITKLDIENGEVAGANAVFRNLNRPHGIVINDGYIYFAEETKVTKVALNSDDSGEVIADLPSGGGGHYTRSLLLGVDGRIYVSIGSTCNVCEERDLRNAAVYSMNKDGTDWKPVAKGLRNAVFMTLNEKSGKIWVTEMGRDNLGDNVPPDEINIIEEGKNYGWPICYGKNIHDTQFDKKTYIRNPCMEPFETPSFIDLQAHSAPLGLAFVPSTWGEYAGDLLVAYHGSWNRTVPTGYKVVRIELDQNGSYVATHDFITGFIPTDATDGDDAIGRPAGLTFRNNALYISDDKAGVVYRLLRI